MRFGLMEMQIDALIPSGLPPKEVMDYIVGFDHATLVRRLVGHGFQLIELGGDLSLFLPQAFSPAAIERLAALQSELNLSYTVHLPLWSVELSTPLAPVRHGSVQAVIDILRATQPLRPESWVLHATGALAAEFYRMRLPELGKAMLLRLFQDKARESLKRILAETGVPSRKLAIETIEFPCELTLELAEEFDLSICLDTGHILAGFSGQYNLFDVLELCLPRLGEVHLHDCPRQEVGEIGYSQDHQALGRGDMDTGRLLDRLSAAGYAGPIIFELRVEEALESLARIRELRPGLVS